MLHQVSVAHRDVEARNVLVQRNSKGKIKEVWWIDLDCAVTERCVELGKEYYLAEMAWAKMMVEEVGKGLLEIYVH